jgi:hypothetical protein
MSERRIFRASDELHAAIKATSKPGETIGGDGLFAGVTVMASEAIPRGCMALTSENETVISAVDGEEFDRWLSA